ncbi:MAG TPA: PP0621 family protein [Burkholderiaceae bacterium]|nr:PP0621 family protein [Burkholderiaceae bacterium]
MSRVLFFVLLALAIYLAWRLLQKKQLPRQDENANVARLPMVSCATCGLHVPRNEALTQDERYFCCEEHRRASPPARE